VIPQEAVELCKRFEGFHRKVRRAERVMAVPYLCPANFWTIGYGHLCRQDHPAITEELGEILLQQDLAVALAGTLKHCPSLAWGDPRRLAAIVDFTFNLGTGRLAASTLRRRIHSGEMDQVPKELRKWVWGGGRKLPGLVIRREAEIALWLETT
jgi:lysozyme